MRILKLSFYLSNIFLISVYLYPSSLLGCLFYNDCQFQPQLTKDFSIFSSNHFYVFVFISLFGFITFAKNIKNIGIYLIILSIFLELSHLIIPNRAFEIQDLFGNIIGVILSFILFKLIKYLQKI